MGSKFITKEKLTETLSPAELLFVSGIMPTPTINSFILKIYQINYAPVN